MSRFLISIALIFSAMACGQGPEHSPSETINQPEPVSSPVISADGLRIAYSTSGDGDVAVVLIHGWMCDQSYWASQVPYLAEHYTVVTIDLGGHGESGDDRQGWPLSAYASDVEAVVKHLDLFPVMLVGHSMGGPVAVEASALLEDRVIGVVGVDTFHNVESKYDPEQMTPFLEALDNDFPTACSGFVKGMFVADADTVLVEKVTNDMCGGPSEVGTALMRQFMHADISALFDGTSVPIRSINADKWPTDIESNRKHSADYDAFIIEGTGHFLMMENPDAFNPILGGVLLQIAHSTM